MADCTICNHKSGSKCADCEQPICSNVCWNSHSCSNNLIGALEKEITFVTPWYKDKSSFNDLPLNVKKELFTWAVCSKRLRLPKDIFRKVCDFIKTPLDNTYCWCNVLRYVLFTFFKEERWSKRIKIKSICVIA